MPKRIRNRKEYNKKWYAAHREKMKEYTRKYQQEHKSECAEARRRWREKTRILRQQKYMALRAANPEQFRKQKRLADIFRTYGLTPAAYEAMLEKQDNVCAICGKAETSKNGNLHVDHSHINGMVRGLLCNRCNSTIGYVQEDPTILQKMIDYIVMYDRIYEQTKAERSIQPILL